MYTFTDEELLHIVSYIVNYILDDSKIIPTKELLNKALRETAKEFNWQQED